MSHLEECLVLCCFIAFICCVILVAFCVDLSFRYRNDLNELVDRHYDELRTVNRKWIDGYISLLDTFRKHKEEEKIFRDTT